MADNTGKENSGRDWKGAIEFVKDGLELVEKLVGGRNALVAGTVGLMLGGGVASVVVKPSAEECAAYANQAQSDRSREALRKFLEAPARGGF